MLRRPLRGELPGRRLGRKLGRKSVRLWMSDGKLRRLGDGKKRRKSRQSRRRNVRRERLGRSLRGSAKKENFAIETAIGIGREIAETATETGTAIVIGTGTEIERGTVMIEVIATEDTTMIRDPADILTEIEIEMTETGEIPAGILSPSQSCQRRRLSGLSRRH
jgi:hypothetical protein